jgi:hypothetical protein
MGPIPITAAEMRYSSRYFVALSADFEAYLAQYPSGSFVPLARTRLAALEPAPAPKPVPAPTPACDGGLVASVGNAGVASPAERCLKPKRRPS